MEPSFFAAFLRKARSGRNRSPDECIRLCADSGFRYLDYSPDYTAESWREEALCAARAAEKYGVRITQSHAPYNFYKREPLDRFRELLDRSVEGARILGARKLVFHFDEYHPQRGGAFDADEALRSAYEALAPAIGRAIDLGIDAALENTFEDHYRAAPDARSHLCADIAELEAAIALFNDERVGCCWDFGHAHLQFGQDQAAMIRRMGKRISCTHVHDNYYGKDLHQIPFYGELDWETLIPALAQTGYDGALAFEIGYARLPDELLAEFMLYAKHTMDILCGYAAARP